VSPDEGRAKRSEQFRQALEALNRQDAGSAYMEKYRSSGVVSGGVLAGDVRGKAAIIIDDLISTGGTLVRAAKACRAAGARKVFAAAAHGLFVGGAPELFASPEFDGIAVTNTVPPFRVAPDVATQRLAIIDVSEAIARAILACDNQAEEPLGTPIARHVWQTRYRARAASETSISSTWWRVARALAQAEPNNRPAWEARFFDILQDLQFFAGRSDPGRRRDQP
jgi:hypothetical protein